jgi:hypothetical protein
MDRVTEWAYMTEGMNAPSLTGRSVPHQSRLNQTRSENTVTYICSYRQCSGLMTGFI